jgi:hypothetical protein
MRIVGRVLCVALAAVLLVAGCSSSGGGSTPSTGTLTAKLKNDPNIKKLEQAAGSKAGKVKQVISCIADALEKDADPDDLQKYVDGKLDLADVGGKAKGSAKHAEQDAAKCARGKLGSS